MAHFNLPSNMLEYATLQEYLDSSEKQKPKEIDLMALLISNNIQSMSLNMTMFSTVSTPSFTSWIIPETWEHIFNTQYGVFELNRAYSKLRDIVSRGNIVFPPEKEIFRAFELCKWDKIKVIILGQDPFPKFDSIVNLPMACGLSFSGRKGGMKPGSLANVFTEIDRTFPGIPLNHYDLTSWAEQGCLMLNVCLTVNQGNPDSHKKVWDDFIEYVIRSINDQKTGVVFLLWGNRAKSYSSLINKKNYILEAGHPSNLNSSVHKFAENNHFAYIYYIIQQRNQEIYVKNQTLPADQQIPYIEQINWSLV